MTFQILSSEIVFKAFHTLRRIRFAWMASDGGRREADHEVLERRDASAILIHDESAGTVILVRQLRVAAAINQHPDPMLEAAAGLIDAGETALEAAIREAGEETGFHPRAAEAIMTIYPSPGVVTERIHLFYARVSREDRRSHGGGLAQGSEDAGGVEGPPPPIPATLADGSIVDAKTIILLQWLLSHRASGEP